MKKLSKFFVVLDVLLLVAIGTTSFYIFSHHKKSGQLTNLSLTVTPIPKTMYGPTTTVGGVNVTYVNMVGLSDFKAHNTQEVQEAQGHYIYAYQKKSDTCGECSQPLWGPGHFIYDGKTVYSGDEIDSGSPVLSRNGLHYAYAIPLKSSTTEQESVYIDSKQQPTNSNLGLGDVFITLADNGKDYGFGSGDSVYVNSTIKYKSITGSDASTSAISGLMFSSDLSNYITGVESDKELNDGTQSSVVYNGQTLTNNAESGSLLTAISDNGQHYAYTSEGVVVVDGKTVYSQPKQKAINLEVTDNGDYSFLVCDATTNDGTVYINGNQHSSGSCNLGENTNVYSTPVLNSNGSHYLYFQTNEANDSAVLDGKPLTLSGTIDNADFDGNTLYVYRWVN